MIDLAIELKTGTEKCLYEQIYEYIKKEIKEGKLLAGEKLPSTRSLAEYLQTARSTVDFAYGQLLSEGYIESVPCKGYFICKIEELLQLSEKDRNYSEALAARTAKGVSAGSVYNFDFSPHAISMRNFPFSTWKKITKDILVDANSEMFASGSPQGDLLLRETISRYLHSSRGVNCRPEQIIIGAGNDYLLLLLEKILGRHIPIAMENPTYIRAYRIFHSFAYPISAVSIDENGICMEELKNSPAKLAYVMPSHQYPTGTVMPIGRRLELLKWAEEGTERYLIEDDYDSEFRYKGKPIPSLQASDRSGKVIYIGTFSKSIAPAIRVSYMVLPDPLLQRYKENCGFYASTVSRIDQRILNEFIRDGYFERYLNKMRKIYKEKHECLLEELRPFEESFILSGENAGLHVLLTSKRKVPEEILLERAAEKGIKLYGLSETYLNNQNAEVLSPVNKRFINTVLLGYGALDKQEIIEGTGALKNAWKKFL